jgi:RNA-directed DNA polymerase
VVVNFAFYLYLTGVAALRNISAENTYPRTCWIQHVLGFTLICGKSRRGHFLIHRKTRRDRMRAKLKEIKDELRRRMHDPIPENGTWLKQVVSGFFAYHAVPTNFRALLVFRAHIKDLWLRTLRRRSQKDRTSWERFVRLADDFLPQPRILHPWPNQRFAVTHPRWAPYAGKPLVRCCAGGA